MKKILVVDDEESIRELYRADLSDEGYEVVLAVDGRQALVLLESSLPNLVTLDIKLPDIDGSRFSAGSGRRTRRSRSSCSPPSASSARTSTRGPPTPTS